MRTEKEMYDLIIGTAQKDERIRAVYMNGSRTNPNVPKDIFQDYDVVYVVKDIKEFYQDGKWIDVFGERFYMQKPDENTVLLGMENDIKNSYGWLIQFADGNRLDLHVNQVEFAKRTYLDDKLIKVLLDKDNLLSGAQESTDVDYWVKKPSKELFSANTNEFWWCTNNLAKGLWREEVPYVLDMLNQYVRPELIEMLSWKIGLDTDFSVSVGKCGKYMYRWLPSDEWKSFLETYCGADIEEIWTSIFIMCDLFDEVANHVASRLGYRYNQVEAENARSWLERVKNLKDDATDI